MIEMGSSFMISNTFDLIRVITILLLITMYYDTFFAFIMNCIRLLGL